MKGRTSVVSVPCRRRLIPTRVILKILSVIALLGLLIPTGACRGDAEDIPDHRFVLGLSADPESFDPGSISGSVEGRVVFNIYEGLYMPRAGEGDPVPGVATHHELTPDGLTYTFHLREDARWSNGDPVTAHDFVFAWRRVLDPDPQSDYITFGYYVQNGRPYSEGEVGAEMLGVRALDDHTLQVRLEYPVSFFIDLVAFYTFFPVHPGSVRDHGQIDAFRAENIVTNGPYELVSFRSKRDLDLLRSDTYWDRQNVAIEEVRMLIMEDQSAHLNAYDDGRIEWTPDPPDAQLQALRFRPDFQMYPMLGVYYYLLNVTDEHLQDQRLREALSLALNRESLCQCTLNDVYPPATAFVPGMHGWQQGDQVRYDPDRARELLAEVYPNGNYPQLSLLYNTSELHRVVAEAVQAMWRNELDIEIELVNQEWKTYLDTLEALDYQIGRRGWIGDYLDPNTFLELMVGDNMNNNSGYANPVYDDLIARAEREPDPDVRMGFLHEAETLLLQDVPVIPVYYYSQFHLVRPWIEGFEMNQRDVHLIRYLSKTPMNERDSGASEEAAE